MKSNIKPQWTYSTIPVHHLFKFHDDDCLLFKMGLQITDYDEKGNEILEDGFYSVQKVCEYHSDKVYAMRCYQIFNLKKKAIYIGPKEDELSKRINKIRSSSK